MADVIRRHDLLEQIRPLIDQLDADGLNILQEWVQDLKVARIQHAAGGELPAPGGTTDAREEFKELLHNWDKQA